MLRAARWYYEAPNRRDIEGVDTVPESVKERRVERAAATLKKHGVIADVVEVEQSELSDRQALGQFNPANKKVEAGPKFYDDDFIGGKGTLAHELGHALDRHLEIRPGGGRMGFGFTGDLESESYEDFFEQIRGQSEKVRGKFSDSDRYRSIPTEQFADYAVSMIHNPRHTRATAGEPLEMFERRAREVAGGEIDAIAKRPLNAASQFIRDAVDEWAEGEGLEYGTDRAKRIYGKVRDAQRGVRERYELEGHRDVVEERLEERRERLKQKSVSKLEDVAEVAATRPSLIDDPVYEGARPMDLIDPAEIEAIEEEIGAELDIENHLTD